jgi:alkane 1-monooxygenase
VTTQLSEMEIAQWRDKKRYLWLMGLIAPTALFVMLPLVEAFNQWGWHVAAQVPFWIGPILLYILLPALDLRFGPDGQNPPDEVMERLENDKYYPTAPTSTSRSSTPA